jgi:hypothetical protein
VWDGILRIGICLLCFRDCFIVLTFSRIRYSSLVMVLTLD